MDRLSRRRFLERSAAVGGAVWVSLRGARPAFAQDAAPAPQVVPTVLAETLHPHVLGDLEWRVLEAISGRLLPGDAEHPGGIEAGVVAYVDGLLAGPGAAEKGAFLDGLRSVEGLARIRFQRSFLELEPAEQDGLLESLARGEAPEWTLAASAPEDFFETLRRRALEGYLGDPSHEGNRGHAGWKRTGYPGPRHQHGIHPGIAVTPGQMTGEEKLVPIWLDSTIRQPFL